MTNGEVGGGVDESMDFSCSGDEEQMNWHFMRRAVCSLLVKNN